MSKKRRKSKIKSKITHEEIRWTILAIITGVGLWFIISYVRELFVEKFQSPFMLAIIGIVLIICATFFWDITKK